MTATAVVATLPSPLSELGGKQATTLREYVSDKFNLPKSPFLVSNLKGFQFHYDKFISILSNLCPLNPMQLSKFSNWLYFSKYVEFNYILKKKSEK